MLLYKFTRNSKYDKVIVCPNPIEKPNTVETKDIDIVVSYFPETYIDDETAYIEDALTGEFVKYEERRFSKTICVEAVIIPQCKRGLVVFDAITNTRKEIMTFSPGSRIYLTLDFNTDKQGNIWARVCIMSGDSAKDGYIVYKNIRNNFANVAITNSTITTVLTEGVVDPEKIPIVREKNVTKSLVPSKKTRALSGGNINLSTGTTSMKGLNSKEVLSTRHETVVDGKIKVYYTYKSNTKLAAYKKAIAENAPEIVQNPSTSWPPILQKPTDTNPFYKYDYTLNYSGGLSDLSAIHKLGQYNVDSIAKNIKKNMNYYNRFKLAHPDDILSRGFMHIFFTRPDCNFYTGVGKGLRSEIKAEPFAKFVSRRNPGLMKQLTINNGSNHEFMLLLSNKAKGFQLTDDGINSDSHGKSMSGYSIAYGRRRDSEIGGTMNISYRDTRNFDILNLHKLWIDYIINVYKGKWTPKFNYIQNRMLDYPVSIYVVVTAEDFETILFWTKYYGVFPVSIPISAITWDGDRSTVSAPQLSISYRYSWKEDLNPVSLAELNMNAFRNDIPKTAAYKPTFNVRNGIINNTWVGAPFVELVHYSEQKANLTDTSKDVMKLRFRA